MDVFNENILKISKPSEKVLANERRNKRKSKVFKHEEVTDENTDINSKISKCPSVALKGNLDFTDEDFKINNHHKYTLELFEKLSVQDKEETLFNKILKDMDGKTPHVSEYGTCMSKERRFYSQKFSQVGSTTASCKRFKYN
jgi:hypothetical protein